MAAIDPIYQQFVDTKLGFIVGIHRVKLVTTSDTVTVPSPSHATANASVAQVRDNQEASATVTQSGNTVTIVGVAGDTVTFCTLHNTVNYGAEA